MRAAVLLRLFSPALIVLLFLFPPSRGLAQTACPQGVAPGSSLCGPDPSAGASSAAPAPRGWWEHRYGAFAIDRDLVDKMGTSDNMWTLEEAKEAAIEGCLSVGGVNCVISAWVENGCIAISWPYGATANATMGAGADKKLRKAKKVAMSKCGGKDADCKIYYEKCSRSIYHQG